jgi:hypothetical protein
MDRNSVIDYVERLRAKPEHVRRRIAAGSAVGITGVVAGAWLLALVFSGSLSITPSSSNAPTLATSPGATQIASAATQTQSGFTQLLSAVGFANASSSAPALTIVDTASSTPSTDTAGDQSPTGGNQTVIPF